MRVEQVQWLSLKSWCAAQFHSAFPHQIIYIYIYLRSIMVNLPGVRGFLSLFFSQRNAVRTPKPGSRATLDRRREVQVSDRGDGYPGIRYRESLRKQMAHVCALYQHRSSLQNVEHHRNRTLQAKCFTLLVDSKKGCVDTCY